MTDLVKNFKCDGNVPNYRIVTGSPSITGAVCITHAAGPVGIVQERGGADGQDCDVKMIGFGMVELAETLNAWAAIQGHIDNTGRAQVNIDINWRVGRILRGGVAGDIVPCLICPN